MSKKIIALLTGLIILLTISIIGSIAFFSTQINTDNIITFGNIKMKIIQTTINDRNQEEIISNEDEFDITYNSEVNRNIKIENIGNESIYLRISLETIGTDRNGSNFSTENLLTYNMNEGNWTYKEGWYYYNNKLEPKNTTTDIKANIIFDVQKITQNYPKSKLELKINAEAVQASNNGENVFEAEGWPKN